MATQKPPAAGPQRVDRERTADRQARREAVRRNAARGPGRNLEEAVRLVEAGDEFRDAFRPGR